MPTSAADTLQQFPIILTLPPPSGGKINLQREKQYENINPDPYPAFAVTLIFPSAFFS
jgi:hypothetical protein